MSKREFESIRLWMKIANDIQGKIEKYELMSNDKTQIKEIRELAREEVVIQEKDLEEFLDLVRSLNGPFSNLLILKYFKGYTLEEAALSLNVIYKSYVTKHANFIKYIKQHKYQPSKNNSLEFKKFIKKLEFVLNPKYETCCINCGSTTTISQDVIRKIFIDESRKERSIKKWDRTMERSK